MHLLKVYGPSNDFGNGNGYSDWAENNGFRSSLGCGGITGEGLGWGRVYTLEYNIRSGNGFGGGCGYKSYGLSDTGIDPTDLRVVATLTIARSLCIY